MICAQAEKTSMEVPSALNFNQLHVFHHSCFHSSGGEVLNLPTETSRVVQHLKSSHIQSVQTIASSYPCSVVGLAWWHLESSCQL